MKENADARGPDGLGVIVIALGGRVEPYKGD
jgi:hypothetical protein